MTKSASPLLRLLLTTLLLLLFALLVTPYLSRTITYDEAYTVRYFAVSPVRALFSYTDPNNHMLHSFSLWTAAPVLGTSTVAVRLPAFSFALLSLAVLFSLGRKLFGFEGGLVAAVLLGTNLTFAEYAVTARGYTLSILLALALLHQVFRANLKTHRGIRWMPLLTSAALILTLPTMIVFIAGMILYLVIQSDRVHKRAYTELLPPLVFGTAIGGIFYIPSLLYGEIGEQLERFGLSNPVDLAWDWLQLSFAPSATGIIAAVIVLAGLSILFVTPRLRRSRSIVLFSFAPVILLSLLQWVLTGRLFFGRNYLYLTAIICLAGGAINLWRIRRGLVTQRAMIATAFIVLMAAVVPFQRLGTPTEIDLALAHIQAQVQEGDAIIMGCCLEEPVIYHILRESSPEMLVPGQHTRRLWVLPTEYDAFEDLLTVYEVRDHVSDCQTVQSWQPFEAYLCSYHAVDQAKTRLSPGGGSESAAGAL